MHRLVSVADLEVCQHLRVIAIIVPQPVIVVFPGRSVRRLYCEGFFHRPGCLQHICKGCTASDPVGCTHCSLTTQTLR